MSLQARESMQQDARFETSDELEIQQLIDRVIDGIQRRDVGEILAAYAPDAVIFDVRDSLRYGKKELEKSWEECFRTSETFSTETRDVEIKVEGDVAFSYFLSHATGTTRNNDKIDVWMRMTTCYGKIDGKWLVIHEHASVPGDFTTGKILMDLKPL